MLFGCIHTPDFLVQAALRGSEVAFGVTPAGVLDGPESLLKVVACDDLARRAGIAIGMTKIQAESCFGVMLKKRVVEKEESAQATLLDCGCSFSPRLESTAPGTVTINLTGSERLLGPPQEIGEGLSRRAEACGFTARIGIASNPDAALHAARGFKGITIIRSGQEATCLGVLPIEVLEPSGETLATLRNWGIRDCKSLAALPEVALTERLGQQGLHLQRLAKGEINRELVPAEAPLLFRESMELEEPVELLEPLAFILNRLLGQLAERLSARSLATDHVQLDLTLEIHPDRKLEESPSGPVMSLFQRVLKLPVPTQDAKVLLKLLQLDLSAHPPVAPVKKVSIEAFPARLRYVQAGLFQPLAPEPARLEITLAHLRAVVGEKDSADRNRVGFPATLDSHRPDSFEVLPISYSPNEKRKPKTHSCLALRLFRPALTARMEFSGGLPHAITFNNIHAKVLRASGPWRSTGDWWDESRQWQRDEWDLYLSIGGAVAIYRVFRDLRSAEWFVAGLYD